MEDEWIEESRHAVAAVRKISIRAETLNAEGLVQRTFHTSIYGALNTVISNRKSEGVLVIEAVYT